jgi:hypothetical protein
MGAIVNMSTKFRSVMPEVSELYRVHLVIKRIKPSSGAERNSKRGASFRDMMPKGSAERPGAATGQRNVAR